MAATDAIGELQRWAGSWVLLELRTRVAGPETAWPGLLLDCGAGFSLLRARALPPCSAAAPAVDDVLFLPRELRGARLVSLAGAELTLEELRVTPLSKYAASLRMLGVVARADGAGALARHGAQQLMSLVRRPSRYPLHERYRDLKLARSARYADWIAAFEPAAGAYAALAARRQTWAAQPTISVLLPVYETPPPLLAEAVESVLAQQYDNWELCIADDASPSPRVREQLEALARRDARVRLAFRERNGGVAAATNSALALARGEYVALLDHDDRLHPLALHFVAEAAAAQPQAGLIYTDEDKIGADGARRDPYFKCAFNYELLLAQNMFNHLSVYRRELVESLGGLRGEFDGAQDYDLALRALERLDAQRIVHVPRVLYHWRATQGSAALSPEEKAHAPAAARAAIGAHLARRGLRATVGAAPEAPFLNRVRFALPEPAPMVSIVIPTRDRAALLAACLDAIESRSSYPHYEIIVVDNESRDPAALQLLERRASSRLRVLREAAPFNYSRLNNRAVQEARGEFVCLMNNDIEVLTPDWMQEMLSFAAQGDVAAVGARLWYPNGRLQHGGVILGLRGAADHAHRHLRRGEPGYFGRALLHQELSAVTAACLMMRKSTYERLQGLDEELPVAFNDVDLCLRARAAGLRNVWTPYAEMTHRESASRGGDDTDAQRRRAAEELLFMERRWGAMLSSDPAYSPNLTLERWDFSPAWPPRLASAHLANKPWNADTG